jgi:phosphohistidine phosphatase
VLRHGKSSWEAPALRDFDRPLSGRGKRDAPRIGRWLLENDLVPDFVVSSPARRARQTARRVIGAIGLDRDIVEFDDRLYEEGLEAAVQVIDDRPPACQRMLIVGHNPTLEDLVSELVGGSPAKDGQGKFFPTAALALLRGGELVQLVRPRDLIRQEG